jgi:hypothetical protein
MGPVTVPPRHPLSGDRGREKIIGFVALGLGAGKAAMLTNCGETSS